MSQKQRIKLSEEFVKVLINTPETGMGFHSVNVYLKDGKVLVNQMVFNSSILSIDQASSITLDDIIKIEVQKK